MSTSSKLMVCRTCLKRDSFVNIYEYNKSHGYRVVDALNELLELKVSPDDRLPENICHECFHEVARFKRFKNLSHEAKITLKCVINCNIEVVPQLSSSLSCRPNIEKNEGSSHLSSKEEPECLSLGNENDFIVNEVIVKPFNSNEIETEKNRVSSEESSEIPRDGNDKLSTKMGKLSSSLSDTANDKLINTEATKNSMRTEKKASDQNMLKDCFILELSSDSGTSVVNQLNSSVDYEHQNGQETEDDEPIIIFKSLKGSKVPNGRGKCMKKVSRSISDGVKSLYENLVDSSDNGLKNRRSTCVQTLSTLQSPSDNDPKGSPGRDRKNLHKCPICIREFDDVALLNKHVDANSCVPPISCHICGIYFCSRSDIIDHMQKFHKTHLPFKCTICQKEYQNNYDLSRHSLIHLSKKRQKATRNDDVQTTPVMQFQNGKDLQDYQDSQMRHQCPVCIRKFDTLILLERHVEANICVPPMPCPYCSLMFYSRLDLTTHVKKLHEGHLPFKCNICQKEFQGNPDLKRHNLIHSGINPFVCAHCFRSFRSKVAVKHHMLKFHIGNKFWSYLCECCGKQFPTIAEMNRHHKIVHSKREIYVCAVCGKNYKAKSAVIYHIWGSHLKYKPYKCQLCPKEFVKKFQLLYHCDLHSMMRQFTCKICNRGFKTKMNLIVHEKRGKCASSKKPYVCNHCGISYIRKEKLNLHIFYCYSQDKSYSCELCYKSFLSLKGLKKHIFIHSNSQ